MIAMTVYLIGAFISFMFWSALVISYERKNYNNKDYSLKNVPKLKLVIFSLLWPILFLYIVFMIGHKKFLKWAENNL